MAAVEVVNLHKQFGSVRAVGGVSLTVRAGEILALLGPSGCGKTTTLRAIAGFEQPDGGDILLGGSAVTHLPANRRGIGMVFQGYALFPHMTVFDNVAFGLRMRKRPKEEVESAVVRALELVQLDGYVQRLPKQLSGGQQQRVALARALAIQPTVLLLDEPLSNLDAKLREEMQVELKRIIKPTGIATIFVTHDQEEAMVLADRIVVMNAGRIEQIGTPREVYESPATDFVASFVGSATFLDGKVVSIDPEGRAVVESGGTAFRGVAASQIGVGAAARVAIRQQSIVILETS